jgi:cytochrome P450
MPLLPLRPLIDHRFFQKQAARHGAVFKTTQIGSGAGPNPFLGFLKPVFCVVGLKQGAELLHDHDAALIPPTIPFSRFIPKGFLRFMDPTTHACYRRIFQVAFSDRVTRGSEGLIAQQVRTALGRMSEISACNPEKGVRPETHLLDMVFGVLAGIFFGIDPESQELARLRTLYRSIAIENDSDREVRAALAEIESIIEEQRMQLSGTSTRDVAIPACYLGELAHNHPEVLDDATVVGNLIYILQASWIDLSGLLLWVFKMLTDHPEWVARLREEDGTQAEAIAGTGDSLACRIVSETLRLEQSEYLYRETLEEVSFGGFVIPKGWLVRICVRESHRSAEIFDNPEAFDPDRFLGRRYSRDEYSPFGASRIMCLGEELTKTFGRIFSSEAALAYDWSVVSDGPREFRRWHWKPSSRFRVTISPRGKAPAIDARRRF